MTPAHLLHRLEAIGQALAQTGQALALIGLGSVGVEVDRLDEHSDLDFFVIAAPGHKQRFVEQLDWLSAVQPLAFAFRNTADGWKALFTDEVFCEFAVFEPAELADIPFAPGRVVWKRPEASDALARPARPAPPHAPGETAWQLGEALTNLYVGLGRYHRGEKLSAARFVQGYAVDRVLALEAAREAAGPGAMDPYAPERRCEQRYPALAAALPGFVQGYARTPESALAILDYLGARYPLNPTLTAAIRRLCAPA